jgi:hypothetical protein
MKHEFHVNRRFALLVLTLVCLTSGSASLAVNSKIARHATSSDLLKGKTENIVIGSRGTIQLGSDWETPLKEFEDVWSINSIVVSGGTVYIGTSPNGGIYKYSLGKLTKIYPEKSEKKPTPKKAEKDKDANAPGDANAVDDKAYLSNEHIFAMTTDVVGRLLAGISGDKCRLCRFKNDKYEVVCELDDDKYIFAIEVDDGGNIYLGTGPEGKVYRLEPSGKKPRLVYDSQDKNILALAAGRDGFVYAGSDSRGLIYKINPRTKTATVLYDSDEPEITALLFTEEGVLHATATSAKIVQAQTKSVKCRPKDRHRRASRPGPAKQATYTKYPGTAS